MLETFRQIFHLAGRDRPARWVALVGVAVITSAFEMLGALLVFLLLGLVVDPEGKAELPLVGDVRGWFPDVDQQGFLIALVVVLAIFFALRLGVQLGYLYAKQRMAHNAGARLSTELVGGYLRLPYPMHLRRSSSELIRNAQQTLEELVHRCFVPAVQVLAESVVVLSLLAVLLLVAPLPSLLAIAVIGGAALVLLKVVQPRLRDYGQQAQEMRMRTLATLQQSLHGIRDVKVLGVEPAFRNAYERSRHALSRALYLRAMLSEMPRNIIESALVGFILALFAFSLVTGAATDQLLPILGLFAYVGLRLLPSLQNIVGGLNSMRYSGPALRQIYDDLRLIEEVDRGPDGAQREVTFETELRLESASYVYEDEQRPALHGADLTVSRGEVVGICGPTGGGKTTLVDLITGLLPPSDGQVTVDGTDIQTAIPSWFRQLGVVPQMVFLIDDTVRNNIALGAAEDEIDEAALREAVQLAQLDDFIRSLPHGLDTQVGERGVRVSGGQRQRIAIARALYRRPQVLILDEGTSALDTATESVLIDSLERLRGHQTILLVAHRLSTVRNCDTVVYLADGRIQGVGTFERLEAESEGFRQLSRSS